MQSGFFVFVGTFQPNINTNDYEEGVTIRYIIILIRIWLRYILSLVCVVATESEFTKFDTYQQYEQSLCMELHHEHNYNFAWVRSRNSVNLPFTKKSLALILF